MEVSTEHLQAILKLFLESEMQRLHIEIGGVKLEASKNGAADVALAAPRSAEAPHQAAPAAPMPAATEPPPAPPAPAAPTRSDLVELTSPTIGVFYRRPAPDKPPFVEVGSHVERDQPVCVVDVMKLFNFVLAPCRGEVVEICAQDGVMVEFGEVLMRLAPEAE